jgi:hypothetical protein
MKRIAALFAAVVFAFAIVACDGDSDATEEPSAEAAVENAVDDAAAEVEEAEE